MNDQTEFRVGLLTVLACALFIWLVSKVEDYKPFQKVYRIGVTFHDVQRLGIGNVVRINGLPVGKVVMMSFKDGLVLTWLEIQQDYKISRQARINVGTAGFFGANYIKISQPIVERDAPQYLHPGTTVSGQEEIGIDSLVEQGQKALASGRVTVDALNKILGDPDFRDNIKATADNLKRATSHLELTLDNIDSRVDNAEERLGEVVRELRDAIKENRPGAKQAIENVEKLAAELRNTAKENGEDIRKLVKNLSAFADNLHDGGKTGDRLRKLLDHLEGVARDFGARGAIGGDLAASAQNLSRITDDFKTVSSKAKDFVTDPRTSERMEGVLDDVHELSDQSKQIGDEISKVKLDLRTNTLYRLDKEEFRNDVFGVASYDDRFFMILGHEFIGQSQGFNTVQFGTRMYDDFIFRTGSFLDKSGVGLDAEILEKKGMLTLEAYRLQRDPILRAIGRYRINDNFNLMFRQENINRGVSESLLGVEHHF